MIRLRSYFKNKTMPCWALVFRGHSLSSSVFQTLLLIFKTVIYSQFCIPFHQGPRIAIVDVISTSRGTVTTPSSLATAVFGVVTELTTRAAGAPPPLERVAHVPDPTVQADPPLVRRRRRRRRGRRRLATIGGARGPAGSASPRAGRLALPSQSLVPLPFEGRVDEPLGTARAGQLRPPPPPREAARSDVSSSARKAAVLALRRSLSPLLDLNAARAFWYAR